MNQQEIDRLFEKHGKVRHVNGADGRYMSLGLMYRGEFTAAIQEATAQARREALEEAAKLCHDYSIQAVITRFQWHTARQLEAAIRALTAQEQEGKV